MGSHHLLAQRLTAVQPKALNEWMFMPDGTWQLIVAWIPTEWTVHQVLAAPPPTTGNAKLTSQAPPPQHAPSAPPGRQDEPGDWRAIPANVIARPRQEQEQPSGPVLLSTSRRRREDETSAKLRPPTHPQAQEKSRAGGRRCDRDDGEAEVREARRHEEVAAARLRQASVIRAQARRAEQQATAEHEVAKAMLHLALARQKAGRCPSGPGR